MSIQSEILVSLGRVVYINFGEFSGKLATIVDIVDGNRVIVNGPTTGVEKQVINVKRIALTRFRIPNVTKGLKQTQLIEKIKEYKLQEKFANSGLGKKIQKQTRRAALTDFERFKVKTLKKELGKKLRTHINKNRKALIAKAK